MNDMNKMICRINNDDIGVFCHIKYNHKKISILIINNYINNDEYLDSINILYNNTVEILYIDDIIYKDVINKISIIKIRNNNKNIKYLELDNKLYSKESDIYYNNESIYLIHKTKQEILVSYGIIKDIYNSGIRFVGNITSNYSLIFSLNNIN